MQRQQTCGYYARASPARSYSNQGSRTGSYRAAQDHHHHYARDQPSLRAPPQAHGSSNLPSGQRFFRAHSKNRRQQQAHQQHAHQQHAGQDPHAVGRSHPTLQGNEPHCQICSFTQPYPAEQRRVFHSHFSSLRLRELTGVEGTDNNFLCPSCKSSHAPYPEDRIKLVISDSSLHKFFALSTPSGSGYAGYGACRLYYYP